MGCAPSKEIKLNPIIDMSKEPESSDISKTFEYQNVIIIRIV